MIRQFGVRARFTLLYCLALIITLLLVTGGIYFFVQRAVIGQIDTHLRKDFSAIHEYLENDPGGLTKVANHGPIFFFRVRDGLQPVATSNGWISENIDQILPADGKNKSLLSINAGNGKWYRVLIDTTTRGSHTYQIAIAHSEDSARQTRKTLALIITLTLSVAMAISLAIGYFIAGRVLAPISAITRKAEEISADNLSERLPVGTSNDEFSRLATVFNQAFARIEDSFIQLRCSTADASHELRTPLAAIRSIGETALHAPDGQADYREIVGSILEESDRLRQLVDALLLLSRADANEISMQPEIIDLAELTRETVEFLNVLSEEKHQSITITTAGKAVTRIDRSSIRQALTNLLDNAIKFAPPESEISITVGTSATNEVFVEIVDCGVGIPASDLSRIFDRFYRVDKGRSRESGGTGLGLSISKWAVERNGGRIEVVSTINQGSLFRMVFTA